MGCSNCGNGVSSLQPAKSHGGLYILKYVGEEMQVDPVIGEGTGNPYVFGTKKKTFWADFRDVPGLFASKHGTDLRSEVQ